MKKNLTDKIVLKRSSLPKIRDIYELPLIEKEAYRIDRFEMKKRDLSCSLPYSFE